MAATETCESTYFTIASKLADLMRIGALSANDKWCTSLLARHPLPPDVIVEPLKVVGGIRRAAVPGELVRFNPYKGDSKSALLAIGHLVIAELEPFVIGIGKVRARQNEEGVIILSRDLSECDFIDHSLSPPEIVITPEMIEAGADEVYSYHRDFESPESLAERLFRAMYESMACP